MQIGRSLIHTHAEATNSAHSVWRNYTLCLFGTFLAATKACLIYELSAGAEGWEAPDADLISKPSALGKSV